MKKAWYAKNRPTILLKMAAKRQDPTYRAEKASYDRQYRQRPHAKARRRVYSREGWRRLGAEALKRYGSKCACCGESRAEFLTIDHVNGGGTKHRRSIGTHSIYEHLRRTNYPSDFQVLCYNCNCSRGHHGYCPCAKK